MSRRGSNDQLSRHICTGLQCETDRVLNLDSQSQTLIMMLNIAPAKQATFHTNEVLH
jgi:hypothetical protein